MTQNLAACVDCIMLYGLARMLRRSVTVCRHATGVQTEQHFSVAHRCLSSQPRDYALPNSTWSHHTKELYDKFMTLSKDGSWKPLPSYDTTIHHRDGMWPETDRKSRLFTRNIDKDGVGFEYCMFYNKAEKRIVCIFQPGPYLEGPPGYTHGGCIATIIDITAGTGAVYSCGSVLTANLNVNYRNPIPLGSTVIIDSRVEKEEGRKVYLSCQIRSHDDAVLHNEATGLFIRINSGEPQVDSLKIYTSFQIRSHDDDDDAVLHTEATGIMLHDVARKLRGTSAVFHHTAGEHTEHHFSVTHRCLSQPSQPRDYALPNSNWSHHTKELYDKFMTLSKDGSWTSLPSYNKPVHLRDDMWPEAERKTRFFLRNTDEDGVGFEYCMFYNEAEKRTVCIFQPGPYLEGPEGRTHGGCIATIIDATMGTGTALSCGRAMTANLNINYRNPIPLGSTVIVDSRVEKVEGRKIYLSCQIRSRDDAVLHTEATGLFIRVALGESEAKL
ncbi:PREDICTED: acyl-coenzyme A thioesterase THEM4 [Nanorana parkeri]|uniref:acyl-coenzyme A thioesterase THEM4 n=1 Tax=Nanorana parkeri TaxID=125878 RepID=UPI0008548860|nr:PREDICTED: acyl-coenzyme A thioesterase THEM4 [Nanorana parkeri]